MVLQKFPAAKWLGFNVVAWGIACACTAAAHNYPTLLVARIFLGIFEAAIAPCLMLLSSMWYTRAEQAPRFSLWYCGLGVGQILGGLISYGFQQVQAGDGATAGWRVMFITLGLVTVIVGVVTSVWLPDSPMKAEWLSEEERVWIIRRVRGNRTGILKRGFKWRHLVELLVDPQIWGLVLITVLVGSTTLNKIGLLF
jgi:MFS family permease